METTDLRTEFTKETKTRFNTEWLAYNDYVDWLEQRLVKSLTIPPVISRLFSELATKHNVKVDDLNLHISCKTLYIQKYTPNSKNEYECLEMVNLNGL